MSDSSLPPVPGQENAAPKPTIPALVKPTFTPPPPAAAAPAPQIAAAPAAPPRPALRPPSAIPPAPTLGVPPRPGALPPPPPSSFSATPPPPGAPRASGGFETQFASGLEEDNKVGIGWSVANVLALIVALAFCALLWNEFFTLDNKPFF